MHEKKPPKTAQICSLSLKTLPRGGKGKGKKQQYEIEIDHLIDFSFAALIFKLTSEVPC